MKNKEFYKDEIYEVACRRDSFAVNKATKKIDGCLETLCSNCLFHSSRDGCARRALDWLEQEHIEPILTDEEKQYLKAVIRPFKDRAKSVTKHPLRNDYAWLYIDVACLAISASDGFSLPAFEKNDAYLGMKFDKKYTIEELGLFEDE